MEKWRDKENVVYIYNGVLFKHREKGILPFMTLWMVLEGIMLSETSQTEKDKYYMFSHMPPKKVKLTETRG